MQIVNLHPITLIQNARTSGGGVVQNVPGQALTVGPAETWQAEKVSIWQVGTHDSPFGMRLTTLMISRRIPDSAVPMSLLADHPNVQFNFYRHGIGRVQPRCTSTLLNPQLGSNGEPGWQLDLADARCHWSLNA